MLGNRSEIQEQDPVIDDAGCTKPKEQIASRFVIFFFQEIKKIFDREKNNDEFI
jgi:hypothetical protein